MAKMLFWEILSLEVVNEVVNDNTIYLFINCDSW